MGSSYLRQHGLEAGPGLGVQAPGDVAGGALQVLLALAAAHLLSLLYEGMVRSTHPLQEDVMPIQELAIPLQQVHGYGQHAPQDVCKPVSQLHTQHTSCQSRLAGQRSFELHQLVQLWQNRTTEMLDAGAQSHRLLQWYTKWGLCRVSRTANTECSCNVQTHQR